MFATTKHSRNCLKRDPVPSEVENTAAGCAKWLKLEMEMSKREEGRKGLLLEWDRE